MNGNIKSQKELLVGVIKAKDNLVGHTAIPKSLLAVPTPANDDAGKVFTAGEDGSVEWKKIEVPSQTTPSVSYTPQTLTENEQNQARKNLGLYYKKNLFDITWDGDTTGKTSIAGYLFNVCPVPENINLEKNIIMSTTNEGEITSQSYTMTDTSQEFGIEKGSIYITYDGFLYMVMKPQVFPAGYFDDTETFVPAGVYFIMYNGLYVSRVYQEEEVKILRSQLDDECLIGNAGTGRNADVFNDLNNNLATGDYSHSEGYNCRAYGRSSHTQGEANISDGYGSFSSGFNNQACGFGSSAFGIGNNVYGNHETVIGKYAAIPNYILDAAEYDETKVYNRGDFIRVARPRDGDYNWYEYEVCKINNVTGPYNVSYWKNIGYDSNISELHERMMESYCFRVGIGDNNSHRKNGFTIDWYGNIWANGTVEGTALILKSSTQNSTKRFKITVDDSGALSATELT